MIHRLYNRDPLNFEFGRRYAFEQLMSGERTVQQLINVYGDLRHEYARGVRNVLSWWTPAIKALKEFTFPVGE